MNIARSAGEVLADQTTLELECVDRMYLNVYAPMLQTGAGAAWFFRKLRGKPPWLLPTGATVVRWVSHPLM